VEPECVEILSKYDACSSRSFKLFDTALGELERSKSLVIGREIEKKPFCPPVVYMKQRGAPKKSRPLSRCAEDEAGKVEASSVSEVKEMTRTTIDRIHRRAERTIDSCDKHRDWN